MPRHDSNSDRLAVPDIAPLDAAVERPTWSVMIPTYNCARFLGETLRGVLANGIAAEDMQVEVVDDCSTTDDPRAVVDEIGRGRVAFHRQPENVGPIRTFNTCIRRARGHRVHILHGDDAVLPNFYRSVGAMFDQWPDVAAVVTRCHLIDEHGESLGLSADLGPFVGAPSRDARPIYYVNPIRTPGVVVRRAFYEQHGGFVTDLIHSADWEMWVRCVALGGMVAVPEPSALYRVFGDNHTGRLARDATNLRDCLRMADDFVAAALPSFDRRRFGRAMADVARSQSDAFAAAGDTTARDINLELWRELTPATVRIREEAARMRSTLRRRARRGS